MEEGIDPSKDFKQNCYFKIFVNFIVSFLSGGREWGWTCESGGLGTWSISGVGCNYRVCIG